MRCLELFASASENALKRCLFHVKHLRRPKRSFDQIPALGYGGSCSDIILLILIFVIIKEPITIPQGKLSQMLTAHIVVI